MRLVLLFIFITGSFFSFLCHAQNTSRIVFFRMDGPIGQHSSRIAESRPYTDALYRNDTEIGKIRSCSIFIYDHANTSGTYYLLPFVNNDVSMQDKTDITAQSHSITFIKLELNESMPITSNAEEVSLEDFEKCYQKNKWLRKKLADAGYASVSQLASGYTHAPVGYQETLLQQYLHRKRTINDTVYFDEHHMPTNSQNALSYNTVKPDSNNLFLVKEYYIDNKQLKYVEHYTNIDSETRTGLFESYSSKGTLLSKGNYKNDNKTGLWEYYYDTANARLWYSCVYEDGIKNGVLTSYYRNGKIKRKEYHVIINNKREPTLNKPLSILKDTITGGTCYDENGHEIAFTPFEIMPEPGYDLPSFISKNIRYPRRAREMGIQGRVLISFTVDTSGNIKNIYIRRHVFKDIDNETIKMVEKMPPWRPGIQDDVPADVAFTLPVVFKLE